MSTTPYLSDSPQPTADCRSPIWTPVVRRLFADALTPVLAYRRLVAPDARDSPSFLFESVVGGERVGRYSFLGARPVRQVLAYGHELIDEPAGAESERREVADPLAEVARIAGGYSAKPQPDLPTFTGGWVGYVGYDTVRYVEPEKLPFAGAPGDDRGLPDLHLQLYRELVVFDHVNKTLLAITHTPAPDDGAGADGSERAAAEARLDELERLLLDPSADEGHRLPAGSIEQVPGPPTMPTSSMGDRGYREAVRRVKQYVAAGDAFQVVPSQRFELRSGVDPFEAYRALRVVNPSPYMFYLQARGAVLVGSSPEILVRVESAGAGEVEGLDEPVRRHLGEPDAAAGEHKRVTSRPLAGTRKRGATAQQDAALEAELLADPKDRAEHVMLVDLHRNDIGRLASPGTIELPELFAVERYSHVMHLSSTVSGLMRRGLTCWDALRYSLPVGTVSGAPKVRAMQIIDELEPTRRGPYAGAVGHADLAGNLDMCIALRTMVVLPPPAPGSGAGDGQCQLSDTAGGSGDGGQWTYHLQAGGGIVADSDPDAEHEETVHKAAALARAIALAEQAFGKAEG